ncbi:MAG: hypothetical protein ACK5M9_04770, partial [Mycobacterium sp.]
IPPPHLDTDQPRVNNFHHPERHFTRRQAEETGEDEAREAGNAGEDEAGEAGAGAGEAAEHGAA